MQADSDTQKHILLEKFLESTSCIPVYDSDEEVFLLYTERTGAGWEHNREVNQKLATFELDIDGRCPRIVMSC
jgi:hypothetical protein